MKIIKNIKSSSHFEKEKKINLSKREEVLFNFFEKNLKDLNDKIESALLIGNDETKNKKS